MAKMMENLKGILLYVKWGNISKDYFGFSRSWIYQRLNGYDGNGNPCDFTESQKEVLREALRDLARKLNETADAI
jgi:hypothetical protein